MNRDRVKGTIDILAGSAKHNFGELTGDTPLRIEGIPCGRNPDGGR